MSWLTLARMPEALMGSVPPMYLIIAVEQHGSAAQSLYLAIGKVVSVSSAFACICLAVCLSFCLFLSVCSYDWLLSLSPLHFPTLSHFCKKIGSFSVYIKSITMATKAACKHLHSQLSPFLRHLGLSALSAVPKHSYSVFTLVNTSNQTHISHKVCGDRNVQ